MSIRDGDNVRRVSDGPRGRVGKVTKAGAKIAGIFLNNPPWGASTVFVVFRGDDLGWYDVDELEPTSDPAPYFGE